MSREQLAITAASAEAIDAIGESRARAIYNHLLNGTSSADAIIDAAYLAVAIGEDRARAIFNELISH